MDSPVNPDSIDALKALKSQLRALEKRNKLLSSGLKQAERIRTLWQQSNEELKKTKAALKASEQRFDLAMQGAQDGLWDWDLSEDKAYFSPATKRILGLAPEATEHIGEWMNRIHPDDLAKFTSDMDEFLSSAAEQFEATIRLRNAEDQYRWVLCRGLAVHNKQGHSTRFVGTMTDLTDRIRMEQQLKLGSQVINSTHEGVVITNRSVEIEAINPAFTALTGYLPEEVIGKNPNILKTDRHDAAFFEDMWDNIKARGHWTGELWNRRKDGRVFAEEMSISAIRDETGDVSHYVGIFSDITERKIREDHLRKLAFRDPLTGLPNRNVFEDRLKQALRQAKREKQAIAALFMDLDRFKQVNDTFGHDAGDLLLVEVTRRIRTTLREEDTIARIGGDEFTAILRHPGGHKALADVGHRIIQSLTAPFQLRDNLAEIGVSIGIAVYPQDAEDPETLLKLADTAMYAAKEGGRNRYCFANKEHGCAE